MKTIITIALIACTYFAFSQNKECMSKSVHDNGKIMTVTINGQAKGHTVDYTRTFNVTGMSKTAKDALIAHITDSLQVNNQTPPSPATPPLAKSPKSKPGEHLSTEIHDNGSITRISIKGFNQNKAVNFERTYHTSGLSSIEKNKLISRITDSLGIGSQVRIANS
jgi:hypothetical protein